jgi:hypothetical protein
MGCGCYYNGGFFFYLRLIFMKRVFVPLSLEKKKKKSSSVSPASIRSFAPLSVTKNISSASTSSCTLSEPSEHPPFLRECLIFLHEYSRALSFFFLVGLVFLASARIIYSPPCIYSFRMSLTSAGILCLSDRDGYTIRGYDFLTLSVYNTLLRPRKTSGKPYAAHVLVSSAETKDQKVQSTKFPLPPIRV